MAGMNPFDLLGDDVEDPTQLAAALPKKVEKIAPVQPAKLPTKPLPPSQAVRESRNGPSGGRGGGGRGPSRGRGGGGFNRNNDAPVNENGFSGGHRPSQDGEGGRRPYVVGYRRGNGEAGGGRRGGFANGESGDVERPRRTFERRSGTGRGNDLKREGAGRGNWGTTEDDIPLTTEEPTTEAEKSPVVEKEGGDEETAADANKETPAGEQEEKEPEDKEMTLEEYEKILEEKKKALQATKIEERKVDTKVFESMQQLSNKKNNDEIFIKLGSEKDKRRDSGEKDEKAKKSLSINEFLKPVEGESYNPRGGYRGRGRGGRGQRGGGGNLGGNQRYGGGSAPAIGDNTQFPSLGK